MKPAVLFVAVLMTVPQPRGQPANGAVSCTRGESIPKWARKALGASSVAVTTDIFATRVDPFYHHGDFNGDGKADLAVIVRDRESGNVGIAFIHRDARDVILVGAGVPLPDGSDDFRWMDAWHVHDRGLVPPSVAAGESPPHFNGDALEVIMRYPSLSRSVVLWWDGAKYRSYLRGD